MAWLVSLVMYATIAAVTLWLHVRFFVIVSVGYCEVKFRRFRIGAARYTVMNAGMHFIPPFIQRRLPGDAGGVGYVFPVKPGPGEIVQTGRVAARTHGGSAYVMAEVEFSYYVGDVAAFMRDEFVPGVAPAAEAHKLAREVLEEAIGSIRAERAEHMGRALVTTLDMACRNGNRDRELKLKAPRVLRVWQLTDVTHVWSAATPLSDASE